MDLPNARSVSSLSSRCLNQRIELSEQQVAGVDMSDPDILLLRFGGFVNYDRDGRVISVRAVTENRTQHMLLFGPPEALRPEDVDRYSKLDE
jgi:hypothetical protein